MMKKSIKHLTLVLLLIVFTACKEKTKKEAEQEVEAVTLSGEGAEYRPNFHYTPKKAWLNDPNGMFFKNGLYHLYYQYYPDDKVWGPMHWGHATSKDMIAWQEQPIALYPDELGYIFSGSAVVDHNNTSGFGKDGKIPVVAIYTSHDPLKAENDKIDVETQSIAYSLDDGISWTKYENNPVIKNPEIRDFRDPKVSWDAQREQWLLVLAAQDRTMFYASKNLKDWRLLSEFGKNSGSHGGVWECPDFFPMQVTGTDEVKWVLLLSINPGAPNGGSGTQYFVGDFDGKQFTLDKNFEKGLAEEHDYWLDFGRDDYAGVTWSNIPETDGRRLFIGWMSNWDYANEVPTDPWRSAMTVARELQLVKSGNTYLVTSNPVKELYEYRTKISELENIEVGKMPNTVIESENINLASTEINFTIADVQQNGFRFILSNDVGNELFFGYDNVENSFFIDRTKSGKIDFAEKFSNVVTKAPRASKETKLTGKILLDKTSIELFYDDGQTVLTEIFFPDSPYEKLSIVSNKNDFFIKILEAHELRFD